MENTDLPKAAASVAPVVGRKTRTKSLINQSHAQALTRAETIALAVQQRDYSNPLAARNITATATALVSVDTARDKVAEAAANTTARKKATPAEKLTATNLLRWMQEVQQAAKQKQAGTNRIVLRDYLVGQHLNGNRANLAQTSQTIYDKVSADTLQGITNAKVKALKAARQAQLDTNTTQHTATTAAINSRAEVKTLLKNIADRRIAIQLAADAEWPHTDPANAGTRKEFGLMPRRPLKV